MGHLSKAGNAGNYTYSVNFIESPMLLRIESALEILDEDITASAFGSFRDCALTFSCLE